MIVKLQKNNLDNLNYIIKINIFKLHYQDKYTQIYNAIYNLFS